jgi:hypothetical protein
MPSRPIVAALAIAFTMAAGRVHGQSFQPGTAPLTKAQIAATLRLDALAQGAARRDFRGPGTAIGAIGLGIAGGITGAAYCGNSENGPRSCAGTTIGFAAGGAAIGAVLGHLLGRLISR